MVQENSETSNMNESSSDPVVSFHNDFGEGYESACDKFHDRPQVVSENTFYDFDTLNHKFDTGFEATSDTYESCHQVDYDDCATVLVKHNVL